MRHDSSWCYEVLGVTPQVAPQELKAAYRDLAKVWHPDRFAHDPRLQQKAQEKLKEINEAYELLSSGRAGAQTRPAQATASAAQAKTTADYQAKTTADAAWSHATAAESNTHAAWSHAPAPPVAQPARSRLPLLSALVFVAVFFGFTFMLLTRRAPNAAELAQQPANAQAQTDAAEQSVEEVKLATQEQRQNKKRTAQTATNAPDERAPAPVEQPKMTVPTQALPTVTLMVDPTTNLIATAACPGKVRMTYPRGNEPHQVCTVHKSVAPSPEAKGAGESFAKRLLSPKKWFKGKDKSAGAQPTSAPTN